MTYRVVTTDGFVLHETNNWEDAKAWAWQQSGRLGEKIIVKRFNKNMDDYRSVATFITFLGGNHDSSEG